eukprot:8852751-Alexandrium_andersonii.AAC.1
MHLRNRSPPLFRQCSGKPRSQGGIATRWALRWVDVTGGPTAPTPSHIALTFMPKYVVTSLDNRPCSLSSVDLP